jgi:hypothetical protein
MLQVAINPGSRCRALVTSLSSVAFHSYGSCVLHNEILAYLKKSLQEEHNLKLSGCPSFRGVVVVVISSSFLGIPWHTLAQIGMVIASNPANSHWEGEL